jgi:hypothetical protein
VSAGAFYLIYYSEQLDFNIAGLMRSFNLFARSVALILF